jgi:3-methylcrotonyl-CoA carboxylase alpha subunit
VSGNLALLRAIAAHPQFAAGDVDTGFVDRELSALTADRAPATESLLLAAMLALDGRAMGASRDSPWAQGDGWRGSGDHSQSIGLRVPGLLRLRAVREGRRILIDTGSERIGGEVRALAGDRFAVDAGSGSREFELIRHRERLQVIGAQADEIALAPAWPFERGVEDADAHPASPLPGRVVDLRVKAGDTVQRGDVLAIVEGMKMQHAIRAGRAGRVAAVLARAGELVEADTELFDIAPA